MGMLVLSRREGESIDVGDAKIVVCRIRGDNVRIGIDAPETIPIRRGELPPRPSDDAEHVLHEPHGVTPHDIEAVDASADTRAAG
jgi:carbon storage regulator